MELTRDLRINGWYSKSAAASHDSSSYIWVVNDCEEAVWNARTALDPCRLIVHVLQKENVYLITFTMPAELSSHIYK